MVDGKLVADLGISAAGQWYYAVVHSTPVSLGWFRADATGRVTVPVPAGLPAGAHTLQLYDASGALVAWGRFTLAAAPGNPDLAATGVSIGAAALALLLAGCAILAGLILQRRRRPSA
jgi:5'-nucleotidase